MNGNGVVNMNICKHMFIYDRYDRLIFGIGWIIGMVWGCMWCCGASGGLLSGEKNWDMILYCYFLFSYTMIIQKH